jgi:hypothetical protein
VILLPLLNPSVPWEMVSWGGCYHFIFLSLWQIYRLRTGIENEKAIYPSLEVSRGGA